MSEDDMANPSGVSMAKSGSSKSIAVKRAPLGTMRGLSQDQAARVGKVVDAVKSGKFSRAQLFQARADQVAETRRLNREVQRMRRINRVVRGGKETPFQQRSIDAGARDAYRRSSADVRVYNEAIRRTA